MVRKAFTLIELVFAIVIIAISVVSLPMMTQTTSKGIEGNIVQEAIFAAVAIMNDSSSYYWDHSSLEDYNATQRAAVINTGAGDCIAAGATNKRIGQISRVCLQNNATTPLYAYSTDSIDYVTQVYNNTPILVGAASAASYKNSYSMTATVNHCYAGTCIQFGKEANNPDLKEMQIAVTKTGEAKNRVILRTYSANIGEPKIESRTF